MNKYLRQNWERSKLFRGIVIIILIYALARIAVHGVFLSEVVKSEDLEGHDLQVYLDAATRLTQHQNLYPQGEISDWIEFYQYAPAYAFYAQNAGRLQVLSIKPQSHLRRAALLRNVSSHSKCAAIYSVRANYYVRCIALPVAKRVYVIAGLEIESSVFMT